jgi:hypothetical protein
MTHERQIPIFINKKRYDLSDPVQTGTTLKHLAGIPLADVLFLQRPGDDEVIANDTKITLHDGDHLHSQPPADYGLGEGALVAAGLDPSRSVVHREAGGWSFLVVDGYRLPAGFQPEIVELLVKLPPAFPDAAPDMFWVRPAVKTPGGSLPRATSMERLLGAEWQRFSWHLSPGAWKPGASTLRDFMRCIASRFLRLD